MSGALEARAIIRGDDQTRAMFESVKARMAGVLQQVAAFDRTFSTVGKVAPSIDAIHVSTGRAAGDMNKFVAATSLVGEASKNASRSTTGLTEALRGELSALKLANEALSQAGVPTGRLVAEQERLRGVITSTTAAIERQTDAEGASIAVSRRAAEIANKVAAEEERAAHRRREAASKGGIGHLVAGTAAGYVAAHGIVSGIEETVKAGASYQSEVVGLQNAGRTPEETKLIQDASKAAVSKLPTASYLENLKVIAETTQAFGSVEHAVNNLEFMQKSMSVLTTAGGDKIKGGPGEVGQALAKWYEERMRPAQDFQKNASAMIPAMVASGGLFNPTELYNFASQAKAAMPSYNDRFMSRIVPSLVTASSGERAGTAANAFDNTITGKARDKKQAAEWLRLGLLDPRQVVGGKGGPIGWRAGAVKGTNLAGQDPLEWTEKVLLPAMKAHGVNVDDRQAMKNELATLFRNQNANFFANELAQAQSRLRLHKDEGLFNQVGSVDEIYNRNLKADPSVGLKALEAALENLMVTVSGPAMGTIASGLTSLAKYIDIFANSLKDHPTLAMTGGAAAATTGLAGAGAMSGLILRGSARAFGRWAGLGGGEAAGEGAAAAAGGLGIGGFAGAALPILAGGAIMAGSIYGLSHMGGGPVAHGRSQPPSKRKGDLPGRWVFGRGGLREWQPDPVPHGDKIIEGKPEFSSQFPSDYTLGHFDHDLRQEPADTTPVGTFGPGRRGAGSAGIAGAGAPATVSLDPNSKVDVNANFKVEASSEFLRIVEQAKSIVASGSARSSGAVGVSSPTKPYGGPAGLSGGGARGF